MYLKPFFLFFLRNLFQDMSVSNANQTNPLEAKRFERPDHAGILQACNRKIFLSALHCLHEGRQGHVTLWLRNHSISARKEIESSRSYMKN